MKSLTGFEYHLTITDFKHYFEFYPVPLYELTVISIIKKIEILVEKYQKEVQEAKKNNSVETNINQK